MSAAPILPVRLESARGATVDAIKAAARDLAAAIAPGSADRERDRDLPFAIFERVREAGIGTLRVPAEAGGPGGSIADVLDTIAVLSAGDPNVGHALRSHFNLLETLAASPATPFHDKVWRLALERRLFAAAHTERGTARPGDVRTALTRTDTGWRLDGRKYYATGAAFADFVTISATDPDGSLRRVFIPIDRTGVQVLDDWDGFGQRLTASGGIVLDGVAVSDEEISSRPNAGEAGRHASTFRQLFLAAVHAGIAAAVERDAADYARRHARPITHSPADTAAQDPFTQAAAGQIAAHAQATAVLLADAAARLDRSHAALAAGDDDLDRILTDAAVAIAKAQTVIGRLALESAALLFDTGGASATSRSLNLDRHWRNARTLLSHNPAAYKHLVVGAHVLAGTPPPTDGSFF